MTTEQIIIFCIAFHACGAGIELVSHWYRERRVTKMSESVLATLNKLEQTDRAKLHRVQ